MKCFRRIKFKDLTPIIDLFETYQAQKDVFRVDENFAFRTRAERFYQLNQNQDKNNQKHQNNNASRNVELDKDLMSTEYLQSKQEMQSTANDKLISQQEIDKYAMQTSFTNNASVLDVHTEHSPLFNNDINQISNM